MKSSVIRSQRLLSLFSRQILVAEGHRLFTWEDVRQPRGYVGTRVAAMENRWVSYKLFGRWTVLTWHHKRVELSLQATIDMFALQGVQHYDGLDAQFKHPLCKLGHDWLGTGRSPGVLQGMGLQELEEAGWKV